MRKEYRIKEVHGWAFWFKVPAYVVQMKTKLGFWITIKFFGDLDYEFAKREAEELLDKLNEK